MQPIKFSNIVKCAPAGKRVVLTSKIQKGIDDVTSLAKHLEDIIWQRGLMKDDDGDLLVIIGNDKKGEFFGSSNRGELNNG